MLEINNIIHNLHLIFLVRCQKQSGEYAVMEEDV